MLNPSNREAYQCSIQATEKLINVRKEIIAQMDGNDGDGE